MLRDLQQAVVKGIRNSYWAQNYTPAHAIVFVTYRCTSRCSACNIWKRPVDIDAELSWDDWHKVLDKLKGRGVRSIELFGGDALLRKDLLIKMVRFCSANGIKTFFPTNSSSLTDKTISDLIDAGLGTVYL